MRWKIAAGLVAGLVASACALPRVANAQSVPGLANQ